MKKTLFALLALVLFVAGCPSNAPAPSVDASAFEAGLALDAAVDAAPHRVGSFNPTCTSNGVPRVVGGVQQPACSLGSANQVLATNAGATDVVWTTPAAGSTPTGTGVPHIVGGVQQAAASLVSQTADVTGVLPLANGGTNASTGLTTANGVVTSSGTALQQAADVFAGADYVSVGPIGHQPTTGFFRANTKAPTAGGDVILAARYNDTTDYPLVSFSAGAALYFGADGAGGGQAPSNIQLIAASAVDVAVSNATQVEFTVGKLAFYAARTNELAQRTANDLIFTVNAVTMLKLLADQSAVASAKPIVGDSANSSPYSVHGKVTDATAGAFTVTAATYKYDIIQLTGGTAGTVTFPLPATDAAAYYKTLINTSGVTKTIAAGAAATTQPFNTGNTARFMFDSGGVHLAAASTAYP